MPDVRQEKFPFKRKPEPSRLQSPARNLTNTQGVRSDKSNNCKITSSIKTTLIKISKRKKVGSNVSIEQLNSAKSRSYSVCFTIESVKKPANREFENNYLLLFFEPQQLTITVIHIWPCVPDHQLLIPADSSKLVSDHFPRILRLYFKR